MAPSAPIIVRKVKYPLHFVVSYFQPVNQQFGSRSVRKAPLQSMHTKRKKRCRVPQLYQLSSEKCSIHYTSLSAMFNPLHSSTNQELFEKHLCNQSSHYEKYGRFLFQREAIMCYCQIDTFRCQQR